MLFKIRRLPRRIRVLPWLQASFMLVTSVEVASVMKATFLGRNCEWLILFTVFFKVSLSGSSHKLVRSYNCLVTWSLLKSKLGRLFKLIIVPLLCSTFDHKLVWWRIRCDHGWLDFFDCWALTYGCPYMNAWRRERSGNFFSLLRFLGGGI